ncbi:MAG: ribonuclease P protein component [Rhizobiales bacterium 32-66-8]|nr:MAG: ribonuclease P protein component [Rhizobiales bacterium 32-66-8]
MDRLRNRRDFLAAAKAERTGVPGFLLQGRNRRDEGEVRLGLTVTKKNGNAVVRNRIRRRLREVARQVIPQSGRPGYDYVMVARVHALHAPFPDLIRDLERAISRLHSPGKNRPAPAKSAPAKDASVDPAFALNDPSSPKDTSAPADGGLPA